MEVDPVWLTILVSFMAGLSPKLVEVAWAFASGRTARLAKKEDDAKKEISDLRNELMRASSLCNEKITEQETRYKILISEIEARHAADVQAFRKENTDLLIKVVRLETMLDIKNEVSKVKQKKPLT